MPDPGPPKPGPPKPGLRPGPGREPPRGHQPASARAGQADVIPAAGPFGRVITCQQGSGARGESSRLGGLPADSGANALIILHRLAFFDQGKKRLADGGKRALLYWACDQRLGQDGVMVADVARRRAAALRVLSAGPARRPRYRLRLRAEPEWRLVVGLGNNANAHEIGLALHGTYGWPVIPGSALKGLAAAWAVSESSGIDPALVRQVLGEPRHDVPPRPPDAEKRPVGLPLPGRGTVCFLDAIPAGRPVAVEADVLTPHVKPYYDDIASGAAAPAPPAEYHNPVPLPFLAVRGAYAVDLYGWDRGHLDLVAGWLEQAGDELGSGAKTAAGYGYLRVSQVPADREPA